MKIDNNGFTERRVYKFTCNGCGRKHAQSFRKSVAQRHRCRKCRYVRMVDDRQKTLFDEYDIHGNAEIQPDGRLKVTMVKTLKPKPKGEMSRLQ